MADLHVIFRYYDEPLKYEVIENGTIRGSAKRLSHRLELYFALLKKHIHVPQPGAALNAENTSEVWF